MADIRNDLAMVDIPMAGKYLSPIILPPLTVFGKAGTLYYAAIDSDVAAETGRTQGAAPTANILAESSLTFAAAEAIDRQQVPQAAVKLMGGLLPAEQRCARIGKRSIMRAKETALVSFLNTNAGATADILDSLMQRIDIAIDAVARVPGELVLACGWTTFRRITRYTEVTNALLRTGVPSDAVAMPVRNIDAPTLASILGVDRVLVGDDDHWTAGTAYIIKVPDASVDPIEVPQIGRDVQYIPVEEGGADDNPFLMESYYSDDLKSQVVDTSAWYQFNAMNGTGIYELTGIDEGNAITTTTTTTT